MTPLFPSASLLFLLYITIAFSNAFSSLTITSFGAKTKTIGISSSTTTSSTTLFAGDSNENNERRPQQEYIPRPEQRNNPKGGDMAYLEKNIQRQMNTYTAIRQSGASIEDCIRDVYARAAPQTTCWYIGKIAFTSGTGVSEKQAIARQLNLIEEHATRLRPVELGRAFGRTEIYTAPGDSEIAVSQNQEPLLRMPRYAEGCEDVTLQEIGFFCEVVTNRGIGFGVERALDGSLL